MANSIHPQTPPETPPPDTPPEVLPVDPPKEPAIPVHPEQPTFPTHPEQPAIRPDRDPDIPERPGPPLSDPEAPHG